MRAAFSSPLKDTITTLGGVYGAPPSLIPKSPFEMILWENVGYLGNDQRRARAYRLLASTVGTTAERIVAASDAQLLAVTKEGGILPQVFAQKLRKIGETAVRDFGGGDLRSLLKLSYSDAKKALMRFPGIGEPGAEKILLHTGSYPVLALDSNALRVLVRLGYAREEKSYDATYRAIQKAVAPELVRDPKWLAEARALLRTHGQEVCKRTAPSCEICAVSDRCAYYRELTKKKKRKK